MIYILKSLKIIQLPCIYHSLGHLKPAHSVTLFNIHALCELGAVKQIKMNFYLIKPNIIQSLYCNIQEFVRINTKIIHLMALNPANA